jgi:hypothetical protein
LRAARLCNADGGFENAAFASISDAYAFRRHHTPNAITSANASENHVMAYCM